LMPFLELISLLDSSGVDLSGLGPEGGTWNQFHANETKFGAISSYSEDAYTTRLDRSLHDL